MLKMTATGILAGMLCIAGSTHGAGPAGVSADLSFMSRYVWRGMPLNDDPVFQPSVNFGMGNFGLNVWGNMDFTDFNGTESEFNEIDYSFDYTIELPALSLSLGAMYYDYKGLPGFSPTCELYACAETGLPGNLSMMFYRDVDKSEGSYMELSAAHAFTAAPFTSLTVSALLGWGSGAHNRYNYEIAGMKGGFTDFSLNFGLPIGLGEIITVTPSASLISLINGDLRKKYHDSAVVFGVSVSGSF